VETLWRKLCRECEPEEKTRICKVLVPYRKGRAECWELALAVVEDQEERRKGDKVAPPSLRNWGRPADFPLRFMAFGLSAG